MPRRRSRRAWRSWPGGGWRVAGGASLDDLRERVSIPGEFDSVTVNGWVLEVLGRFPNPGDAFDYEGCRVTVEKVDHRRVESILIEREKHEG